MNIKEVIASASSRVEANVKEPFVQAFIKASGGKVKPETAKRLTLQSSFGIAVPVIMSRPGNGTNSWLMTFKYPQTNKFFDMLDTPEGAKAVKADRKLLMDAAAKAAKATKYVLVKGDVRGGWKAVRDFRRVYFFAGGTMFDPSDEFTSGEQSIAFTMDGKGTTPDAKEVKRREREANKEGNEVRRAKQSRYHGGP